MKKFLLSEKIKRPPKPLTFETYLREQDHPISAHPQARSPRIVPLVILDYGSLAARVRQSRYIGKYLVAAVREMAKSARTIRDNPHHGQKTMGADMLQELEGYAHSLGVTDIGYTRVNTRYIFKNFKLLFSNAIVFTMEMDKQKKQRGSLDVVFHRDLPYLHAARGGCKPGSRISAGAWLQCPGWPSHRR